MKDLKKSDYIGEKKSYTVVQRVTVEEFKQALGPELVKQGELIRELEEEIIAMIIENNK